MITLYLFTFYVRPNFFEISSREEVVLVCTPTVCPHHLMRIACIMYHSHHSIVTSILDTAVMLHVEVNEGNLSLHSSLKTIPAGAFRPLRSLEMLVLDNNLLSTLSLSAVDGLGNLQVPHYLGFIDAPIWLFQPWYLGFWYLPIPSIEPIPAFH